MWTRITPDTDTFHAVATCSVTVHRTFVNSEIMLQDSGPHLHFSEFEQSNSLSVSLPTTFKVLNFVGT